MKKAMHDLQAVGEALVELGDDRLQAMPMPEPLRDALLEYRRTRSHEGRRRQMQYIGRLMRHADVEPLREAVAEASLGRAHDALALHDAERWRDELLAHDDHLTRWMRAHPASDLQQLRSLIRAARRDAADAGPPGAAPRKGRAYRELFQFIKAHAAGARQPARAQGPMPEDPQDD